MQPKVLAVLVTLVLLSAPPAVVAAMLVRDLRRARRPLPSRRALARVALALNAERAATPGQCRLALLRQRLFDSCQAARAAVPADDDLHAGWLLGDALRLARRLDAELRELWPVADAAPERLDRATARVEAVAAALLRLREAVSVRAALSTDALVAHLVDGVAAEHAARLRAGGMLHRGGGLSLPARDIVERNGPAAADIVRTGAPAP